MLSTAADVTEAFEALAVLRSRPSGGGRETSRPLTRGMLEPVLDQLGITRVGDLTGLDELGVPVWFAVRPGSRSLCISNGKGVDPEAAWLSAVMESAEQALAEAAAPLVALVASPSELARRGLRSIPLQRQSRCAARRLSPDRDLAWVKGLSWTTGETVFAPYELVGLDMAAAAPWNTDVFSMSSLGLASGADLMGAMLHGLRELVEEDAIFAPLAGGVAPVASMDLTFRRDRSTDLEPLVARLAEKGMVAGFAEVTDGIDMPVVLAALRSRHTEDKGAFYFSGSACRSTVEAAALAALLEALQSRLTYISGARDDLFADEYGRRLRPGTEAFYGGCRFHDGSLPSSPEPDGDLDALVAAVRADGIPDVYVFALGGQRHGFAAVRVLADDLVSLQGPSNHARDGRAGRKLLRNWVQA